MRTRYTQDFEEFWANYPKNNNMSKKTSFRRWLLMNNSQRKRALLAIPAFKRYCAENKWYHPVYADRFLSQERYEGFIPSTEMEVASAKDRADRMLKRGKYAERYA
jgi:hypothetical protein